jgi:hypothetical protein
MVLTDKGVAATVAVQRALESLERAQVEYVLYDQVRVVCWRFGNPRTIDGSESHWCRSQRMVVSKQLSSLRKMASLTDSLLYGFGYGVSCSYDTLAGEQVGGGSVMDTAKAANLYATYPPADFLDYVRASDAPVCNGLVV